MFNPKINNLLDDQLAVSGLEMGIEPLTIAAGVSAASSLIGGIMGSSQASKQNSAAKKAEKEQKKLAKQIANSRNEHNEKVFEAEQANYYAMRDFNHESRIKDWKRANEIQDYKYLSALKQYEKNLTISGQQLDINADATDVALESEKAALDEAFIQQQFQYRNTFDELKQTFAEANFSRSEQFNQLSGIANRREFGRASFANTINTLMEQNGLAKETQLVEGMLDRGKLQASAQAGKSAEKGRQSSLAQMQRGLMGLEAELSGNAKKSALQLAELNMSLNLEKTGIGLNLERIENTVKNAGEETQFNLDVMRENMKSTINQTKRNIEQVRIDRNVADLNTKASMMLFPERLSYTPAPELPPERIFVEPEKAIPGYVPPATQQNVWAPLVSGVASAAGSLASIDFGGSSTPKIGTSTNYFQ